MRGGTYGGMLNLLSFRCSPAQPQRAPLRVLLPSPTSTIEFREMYEEGPCLPFIQTRYEVTALDVE